MNILLVVLFLGAYIACTFAKFVAVSVDLGPLPVLGMEKVDTGEAKSYAEAYAEFRKIASNSTKTYNGPKPKGLTGIFTVPLDEGKEYLPKLVNLEEDEKSVIEIGTQIADIKFTGPIDNFAYDDANKKFELEGLYAGTDFIEDLTNDNSVKTILEKGDYKKVEAAHLPFYGTDGNEHYGNFRLFAVVYSK